MGGGVAFTILGSEVRLAPFYSWEKEVPKTDALELIVSTSNGERYLILWQLSFFLFS
jgi:hypothetical protein